MTAERELIPKLPPRWSVRAAWALYRTAYRLTGGRFGLWSPTVGGRFGTLRIRTIGRRTGQPRVAIVDCFEDGPNLVTLALNGWADTNPAWWLSLQAPAEATVDLAAGRRAGAAAGEERARLWAESRDYRGCADDLDALASRRAMDSAVVVLERREEIDVSLAKDNQGEPNG